MTIVRSLIADGFPSELKDEKANKMKVEMIRTNNALSILFFLTVKMLIFTIS
jgi:hypothetical protein